MADKLKGTLTPKANLTGKLYMSEKVVVGGVTSVNGQSGDVTLTAEDVGALAESELDTAIDTALAEAKASGDFKGDKGDKGDTGATGAQGADGAKGVDGYSPTAYVYKEGATSTLTVVDQTGATQVSILDGEKGDKGEKGDDGYSPVKGTDYWTESDKAEIVADATEELTPLIPSVPVQSVNGKAGDVQLSASDVNALPDTTDSLKCPNSLTINIGSEFVVYDGSEAKTVTILDGSEVSY